MITHHSRRALAAAVVAAAAALGLAGCNGLLHPENYPTDGPTFEAKSNPQPVTAADFGHSWALTVDKGNVSCETNGGGDPALRFTAPDGTAYALNNVEANAKLPPITDIAKGSVGTLLSFSFYVCDV